MRFITPVAGDMVITGRFNDPRNFSFAPKRKQLHEGIDFAPRKNNGEEVPVYAANDGEVLKIGWDAKGYGHYVYVKHNEQFYTYYAHLKEKSTLSVGDRVDTDTILGYMGSTGYSTGKHLHFTVQDLVNGLDNYVVPKVVDPFPLLSDKIDYLQIPNDVLYLIDTLR